MGVRGKRDLPCGSCLSDPVAFGRRPGAARQSCPGPFSFFSPGMGDLARVFVRGLMAEFRSRWGGGLLPGRPHRRGSADCPSDLIEAQDPRQAFRISSWSLGPFSPGPAWSRHRRAEHAPPHFGPADEGEWPTFSAGMLRIREGSVPTFSLWGGQRKSRQKEIPSGDSVRLFTFASGAAIITGSLCYGLFTFRSTGNTRGARFRCT